MGRSESARGVNTGRQLRGSGGSRLQRGEKTGPRDGGPYPGADDAGLDAPAFRTVDATQTPAPEPAGPVDPPPSRHGPQPPDHPVRSARAAGIPVAEPGAPGWTTPTPGARPPANGRRARLARIDLWSVATTSALVSLGLGLCVVVALTTMWVVDDLMSSTPEAGPSPLWAMILISVTVMVEVVLGTALVTLTAFFYNLAAQHTGGIQLTLDHPVTTPGRLRIKAFLDSGRLRPRLPARRGTRLGPAASDHVGARHVPLDPVRADVPR
ncbi:DUF3566 domain-containing protein [Streptomyces sp. NPDC017936]|uniref:DUF3566 domain-containing protein n=1 Tax=Streptomyces sp. NPDC017936 TaxID=3365016 RepID=UPI003797553F